MPVGVRSSGWSVSLTHPVSGRVIRPDVIDPRDVQYVPGPNTLPRIRIPVRRAPEWLESEFDDNPAMSVHLDGDELPIDELVDVELPEGRTVLVGEGGVELRTRVQEEYDAEERPQAAIDLVNEHTTYATVDDTPASSTTTGTVQSPSGEEDLEGKITLAETDPFVFTGGGIKPAQICWTTEGENNTTSSGTNVTSIGSAYSDGSAYGISDTGDTVTWNFTPAYDIPAGELGIWVRDDDGGAGDLSDGVNEFEWYFENELVEDFANAGVNIALSWSDLHEGRYTSGSWDSPALTAGTTYSITLECTNGGTGSDTYVVDVIAPIDLRYESGVQFDNDTAGSNGYLDGPEYYPPSLNAEFDPYESAFSVTAGEASVTMTDTGDAQALALSNDDGNTYPITASNATTVSGTFNDPGAYLNLRATLSRYEPDGVRDATPRYGYDAQRLDAYTLEATEEFESLLIDQDFDDQLVNVINQVLGEQFAWKYSIEDGTPTVTVDEPGNTVAARDPEISAQQIDKRLKTYQTVAIRGSGLPVSGENFSASSSFVGLNQDNIITGTEAVYSDDGTQYQRGSDYEINYGPGEIRAIDGGDLSTGTEYNIDYRHRAIGSHTVTGATGDELVRTIPGVVTDRQAEQIAFVLAEVEPELSVPRFEGDIVVPRVDSTFDPLAALQLEDADLPDAATPLSIRGEPELTPLGLTLRLGSAPRLEQSLSAIAEQVGALSDRA